MDEVIASVEDYHFMIQDVLNAQNPGYLLPFENMDKSYQESCRAFTDSRGCKRGALCPYRHVHGEKSVVCKYWFWGRCKQGDGCEGLHRYDLARMPECQFWQKHQKCERLDNEHEGCDFTHTDPNAKKENCPHYERGFCKLGSSCPNRHVKKTLCHNYLCGFCPLGPECKYTHPRWELRTSGTTSGVRPGSSNLAARVVGAPATGNGVDVEANPLAEVSRTIECPDAKVGLIIGKQGATHRQLQDSTGAKVSIPKESAPGSQYRQISITGNPEQVEECIRQIMAKVGDRSGTYSGPASGSRPRSDPAFDVSIIVDCPDDRVGLLIGKQGVTFRQLQDSTGCTIDIPKACVPGESMRHINVRGSEESVQLCRQKMYEVMAKHNQGNRGMGMQHHQQMMMMQQEQMAQQMQMQMQGYN